MYQFVIYLQLKARNPFENTSGTLKLREIRPENLKEA